MATWLDSGIADMAATLQGSSILAIAAQVRGLIAAGQKVCNLTIGDFDPKQYPLPPELIEGTHAALQAGHSNYPPPNGIPELRSAVQHFYKQRAGLDLALDRILIAGGARPVLYGAYRALVNPGDKVIYPVPSWNNNHYAHLCGAIGIEIEVGPEDNFLPTLAAIEPHLHDARLLVINSPLNPSGTLIGQQTLSDLCDRIVGENERRKLTGQKPLFLIYDQIYWLLTMGDGKHFNPLAVHPAMADYTVLIDGISKCFAATGLRVGWTVGPASVVDAMSRVIGHVGAWAPKAEQVATSKLLLNDEAVDRYLAFIREAAGTRLQILHAGLTALGQRGAPVRALVPHGSIYLSAEFALRGYRDGDTVLKTSGDVRKYLLEQAGLAVVPFDAFGAHEADDWYRLSVGAVSVDDVRAALVRLEAAIARLTKPKSHACTCGHGGCAS